MKNFKHKAVYFGGKLENGLINVTNIIESLQFIVPDKNNIKDDPCTFSTSAIWRVALGVLDSSLHRFSPQYHTFEYHADKRSSPLLLIS